MKRQALNVIMAALVVTLSGAGVAHAATSDLAGGPASDGHRVYTTMHSIGFDKTVAAAHGYEIRTTSEGRQYSVRKGAPASMRPLNVVSGDCGQSWVWEDAVGNLSVDVTTGYDVYTTVHTHEWRVVMDDKGGESTQNFSGGPTPANWDPKRRVKGLSKGSASVHIKSNGSNYAILDDGNICYSAGPSALTTIY